MTATRSPRGWDITKRLGPNTAQELLDELRPMTADTWQRICDLYGWPQTFA